MTDSELLREFIRVKKTEKEVQILVHEIRWDEPSTPIHTWEVAKTLPGTASKSTIDREVAGLLEDPCYFRTCFECGERKPVGWMSGDIMCQECAQTNHGVVY